MYHPSVSAEGEVCRIKEFFGPTKMLKDIGVLLLELLGAPDASSPANADAGAEFATALPAFEQKARDACKGCPKA